MDETTRRAERLCDMMDEHIRDQSPATRDRLIQQYLAEAKTPSERFRTLGVLMNFVIAANPVLRKRREAEGAR